MRALQTHEWHQVTDSRISMEANQYKHKETIPGNIIELMKTKQR